MMNFPPEGPRPDVGCVVKAIAIIGALAVLALVIYMGGVALAGVILLAFAVRFIARRLSGMRRVK